MGIILYQMFTGAVPFDAQSVAGLLVAHAHEVPAPPSVKVAGFDPALERIILRCLEKDPAARFPSARALCDALSLALPGMAHARNARGEDLRGTTPAIPSAMAAGVTVPRRAAVGPEAAPPSMAPRNTAGFSLSRRSLVLASGAAAVLALGAVYLARRGPAPRAPTEISAPPWPGPILEGREG
jgi:serine/threonine-protein kinase